MCFLFIFQKSEFSFVSSIFASPHYSFPILLNSHSLPFTAPFFSLLLLLFFVFVLFFSDVILLNCVIHSTTKKYTQYKYTDTDKQNTLYDYAMRNIILKSDQISLGQKRDIVTVDQI